MALKMSTTSRKGTRRACDPCSVRKVRCDGNQPCLRCEAASWECTYLKTHGKSGPKGPRRTTEAAIKRLQERSKSTHGEARSHSESSLDAASPTTAESPYIDPFLPDSSIKAWTDGKNPHLPATNNELRKLSVSCISQHLEIYQARGYGIWPVVDTEALIARLLTHPEDLEAYSLATAICAAIVSQFSFDDEPRSPVECHYRVSAGVFNNEAKKARRESDHMENVSIFSMLGSFFLHVYSANVGCMNVSTILLGEAITKAHMIGLHKTTYYQGMTPEQTQHALRIYWLLFITERAHSLQHDMPTTLKRSPDLPALENLNNGSVTPAYVQLCRLFKILDVTITVEPSTARNALALAQQQLNCDEASLSLEDELQRADIIMTQQWMRIFLWQHALNVTKMSREHQNEEFSFSFPAKVAQTVLSSLNTLSRQSIEAHGPGMESKLFDVANSLADVMMIMPSMNHKSHFSLGPRDLVHSLSRVLAGFRGGNPAIMGVLQQKLATLGLAQASPQRMLLEFSSPEEEPEDWQSSSRAGSTTPRSIPSLSVRGSQSPTAFPARMRANGT